jgi:hypothetical protein
VAIIHKNTPIVSASDLVDGLERAVRGLVQLVELPAEASPRPTGRWASGWLVTGTLVVVPDHVAYQFSRHECRVGDGSSGLVSAEVVDPKTTGSFDGRPVLLRLACPAAGKPLALPTVQPAVSGSVFVLFYLDARPTPSVGIGQLLRVNGDWLQYDANTVPGSSGGPVFDMAWNLIGMHVKSGDQQEAQPTYNEGMNLAGVLAHLRTSQAWPEIAAYHQLADVSAAVASLDRLAVDRAADPHPDVHRLRAAVLWRFAPEQFDRDTRDWLKPRVVNPAAVRWGLLPDERVRLLGVAGSLAALRAARGEPGLTPDPGQRVIDRLLAGPPFPLAEVPSEDLPYWLQAVRWFADVLPDVPTPAAVNRELGWRRVIDRLARLVGSAFRGRATELDQLRAWDSATSPAPLVVFGIGGVGKSALIARYADELLRQQRVVLWLDFDRADLAPDDALSVLTQLNEQAGIQLPGFRLPEVSADNWAAAARGLGAELTRLSAGRPPLLVLDGFEVAQHIRRHTELWPLLDAVMATAPQLRALIAGRAPVPVLTLGGRLAEPMEVIGMSRPDAVAWLREGGIPDGPVQDRLLDLSDRVPLALKLAVKLKADGGKLADLPVDLPRALIQGYLYQRVLDRVIDPALRDLARGALVLRRVTTELLGAVLGDLLAPGLAPEVAFERLTQELALVEGDLSSAGAVLRVRPEVRAATVKLLKLEDVEWVRRIDRRAADWYSARDLDDLVVAAERVYHLLQLGDTKSANLAWRKGCGQLLLDAETDLPAKGNERAWLRKRIDSEGGTADVTTWEVDAVGRVRDALRRGLDRLVAPILGERTERSPTSPLLVYDACLRWQAGDAASAKAVLKSAPHRGGTHGRDRAVMEAFLAAASDPPDRPTADELLAWLQAPESWSDQPDAGLVSLAVQAARIRLTVDLDAELRLLDLLGRAEPGDGLADEVRWYLTPLDVVLPALAARVTHQSNLKTSAETVDLPIGAGGLAAFAARIDALYARLRVNHQGPLLPQVATPSYSIGWMWHDLDRARLEAYDMLPPEPPNLAVPIARDLAVLAWRRWRLAVETPVLAEACNLSQNLSAVYADPLRQAVLTTMAAYHGGQPDTFQLTTEGSQSLTQLFAWFLSWRSSYSYTPLIRPTRRSRELVTRVDTYHSGVSDSFAAWLLQLMDGGGSPPPKLTPVEVGLTILDIYLLGPDPLEVLVRQALGLPNSFPL